MYLQANYDASTESAQLDKFKAAYRKAKPSEVTKTQWDKKKNEEKIVYALKWAMTDSEVKLDLPYSSKQLPANPIFPFGATQKDRDAVSTVKASYDKLNAVAAKVGAAIKAAKVSVFGVALVDVGTSLSPDIRAYFSPSGSENTLLSQLAAQKVTTSDLESCLPHSNSAYKKWSLVSAFNANLAWKDDYMTRAGKSPKDAAPAIADPGFEFIPSATKVEDWRALPFADASIVFGMKANLVENAEAGPTFHKKWKLAGSGPHPFEDSAVLVGTCALQKLVYGLFGVSRPEFGHSPLYRGAQSAIAAPRLICAAEAVARSIVINVRKKDGNDGKYGVLSQVPSCVACQAVLPKLMSTTKPVVADAVAGSRFLQIARRIRENSLQPESIETSQTLTL